MTMFIDQPPSAEALLEYVAKWVAHALRAKITVRIEHGHGTVEHSEYDRRIRPKDGGEEKR